MSFMNVPKNVGRRGAPFIAPGGNQVGNYMVHVYTSNGTFVPESEGVVDMLLVAGGGGACGGGGGAGGFREITNITLTAQSYSVQVGAGGPGGNSHYGTATKGDDSWLANQSGTKLYEASGGGAQNQFTLGVGYNAGSSGGSGAGGDTDADGGAGNIGGYSPVEGFAGGGSPLINERAVGGGGGGASQVGGEGPGDGGDGKSNTYRGQGSQFYSGGGGGGAWGHPQAGNVPGGEGGTGGGGDGGGNNHGVWGGPGNPGTPNTGGGAGAGQPSGANLNTSRGGSGIVIIRYAIDQ